MADDTRTVMQDFQFASRKAEEAASRRYAAVHWLKSLVGPLGISEQPSEKEFISCLRNGLILCNLINKIQPGAVPKVVENHLPSESLTWDSQPLPAYQYFENVKNFLVVVQDMKLPAFEASDLERDDFEAGSVGKVVDCILALKAFHELKQMNGTAGVHKIVKSPLIPHSASKNFTRPFSTTTATRCRRLDLSEAENKHVAEDSIVKALADHMFETKENINDNLLASFQNGHLDDPVKNFSKILSGCLEKELLNQFPELKVNLKDILKERSSSFSKIEPEHENNLFTERNVEVNRGCSRKESSDHMLRLRKHKKDLSDIKALWIQTKREFEDLQYQLFNDLKQLGSQVEEMSTAALGYQKVVQENRNLFNMVQDLKGSIRVFCRIKPILNAEAITVINVVGDDGSMVLVDPSRGQDARKAFQFNHVYGPIATQDEVYRGIRPLVRSVIDGYNVCIMAYGEHGSGKTYTMCGSLDSKDLGMNHLALNDLFQMSNQRKDIINYEICVQMTEICNEEVQDLLAEDSSSIKPVNGSIAGTGGRSYSDATLHPVRSLTDVFSLTKLGRARHTIGSSVHQAHSVLTVHVNGKDTSGSILRSCLHLVDLAGSEQVDKSVSCLGEVITALSQKNSKIPYSSSKLTLLLQDALGGSAKILMLAHVSPEEENYAETINTLKFAQRVSMVELKATCFHKQSSEVTELKHEIERLKKALANNTPKNAKQDHQPTSPCEKTEAHERTSLLMAEQTPSKSRRRSIEHPSIAKSQKMQKIGLKPNELRSPRQATKLNPLQTGPRDRKLNIENSTTWRPGQLLDAEPDKLKGQKSPQGRRVGIAEKTPPRIHQRSVDDPSAMKTQNHKVMVEPRSRRLSIEKSGVLKPMEFCKKEPNNLKGQTSHCERRLGTTERTPPRIRRLSIEHPNAAKTVNTISNQKRLKTPSTGVERTSNRVRRLSLEGTKAGTKDQFHKKQSEHAHKLSQVEAATIRNSEIVQEVEADSKSSDYVSCTDSAGDVSQNRAPESPQSSAYSGKVIIMTGYPLQRPDTVAPRMCSGTEAPTTTVSETPACPEHQTPNTVKNISGKGSQIRKSIRSIRRLINGSEKRNRQKTEAPSKVHKPLIDAKSPITAGTRTLKRQSSTGNQTIDSANLRRSSIGGKTGGAYAIDRREPKSPPSVRSSSQMKR